LIPAFGGFPTLLRKDAREAWVTTLVLVPLTALASMAAAFAAHVRHLDTSPLEALRGFALLMLPTGALAWSHVVVSRELSGKTQLFLEALPIRRASIFLAKLTVLLAAVTLLALAVCTGSLVVPADQGMTAGMLLRVTSFAWFIGALFFLVGLLGRYRLPLAFLACAAAFLLFQVTTIDLSRAGPLGLVDETLFLERHVIPWHTLALSSAVTAALLLVAALLALARETDLPARFAERMSQREKVFIAVSVLAIIAAGSTLEEKKPKSPYVLQDAAVKDSDGITVAVGSGVAGNNPADEALASYLHEGLARAHAIVGLPFSRVIVVSSSDMPPGLVESGTLDAADGILFRTRPSASAAAREQLLERAVHAAVARATHGRALLEHRRFVLGGFGTYVARQRHLATPLETDDDLWLQALCAAPDGPTLARLAAWSRFEEEAGVAGAHAFAFTGLRVLAATAGEQRTNAFLHAALGFDAPNDVRALWRTPDLDRALLSTCGMTRDAWLAAWRSAQADARQRLRLKLIQLPRAEGVLAFDRLGPRTLRARVSLDSGSPLKDESRVELQTVRLAVSRDALDEEDATREELSAAALKAGAPLPYTFARGDRFAWRLVALGKDGIRVPSRWHRTETH
jgi:hypothetical protein